MAKTKAKKLILVPVDFSAASEAALLEACDLADCLKVPVVILHVVHDPGEMPGYYSAMLKKRKFGRMQDAAKVMLDEFVYAFIKRYSEKGVLKRAERMLVVGLPATRIIQVAEKINATMVVMGSKGETGLKHLMLGSVAERVVQLCPVPVLVVKAKHHDEK